MNLFQKLRFWFFRIIFYLKYIYNSGFYRAAGLLPKVQDFQHTVDAICNMGLSLSRFGDGEMRIIRGGSIEFQKYNPLLAERLSFIIQSELPGHLVGIPDVFSGLSKYKRKAIYIWQKHLSDAIQDWVRLTKGGSYANAFLTRPYIIYKDNIDFAFKFHQVRTIWEDRDIVFIEGDKSRLGIGNDLFDNAKSIKRILCPAMDAFEVYDQILEAAKQMPRTSLLLLALGPTATVLAYDLCALGFQAVDIGHIDIEYEWYLRGDEWMVKVDNKFVNEAVDGNPAGLFTDEFYLSQIIKIVKA